MMERVVGFALYSAVESVVARAFHRGFCENLSSSRNFVALPNHTKMELGVGRLARQICPHE